MKRVEGREGGRKEGRNPTAVLSFRKCYRCADSIIESAGSSLGVNRSLLRPVQN